MTLRPLLGSTLLAACLALASAPAAAQGRSLDIERFRPAPDRNGFIGIPGTRTPGEWGWNASLVTSYSAEPLTFRRIDDGTRLPVIRHRVGADFIAQLGILDRVAVVLDAPVVLWQDTDTEPLDGGGPALAAVALRDPYVATRVRILGEGSSADHARSEGEGLALQVGTTLPFGLEQSFAGEGNPQLEAMVIGDFHFLDFGVGANVGYRHRFAEPRLLGVQFANELFFGLGLKVPTFFVANLGAIVEVRVETALDQEAFQDASTAVEGDFGLRWAEGDIALSWVVGTGFNGGVGTPAFRGIFGIELAPRTHDLDGDGLVDDADHCPRLPEDIDDFEDDDGCPDPDNDGDLIPDEDDRCPLVQADFDRDEDEDGCTDPVRDADGDGVSDDVDACPGQPEDRDGHDDEDGCPDLDDDGDGVADALDRCPAELEDVDGFEDGDGCPDPDDDGDGVGDADDQCPRDAEDRDGHDDEDGCPDPDDDRDGVIDGEDRCPDQAETINGVDDTDGCPDRGGQTFWRAEGAELPPGLRGRVRFGADGALHATSRPVVDQLARHLLARWGIRWQVAIAEGAPAHATALRAALVERGVPENRFEVVADPTVTSWNVFVRRAPAPVLAPSTPPPSTPPSTPPTMGTPENPDRR